MSENSSKNNSIVSLSNVTFKRGDKLIFNNLSMEIEKGKLTVVLGPSGTGKTTFLRLIAGQLLPDSGTILSRGFNIGELNTKQLLEYRKKIGLLFQSGALFNDINVFENVAFPLREHTNLSDAMIYDLVLMKLHAVGLHNAIDLMPHELSGGMARRAALARTIALDPNLIMYDEPFTGQDPISLGVLCRLARTLNDALETSTIIVSHDIDECLAIADYIYVLYDGAVVAKGTADELKDSKEDIVRQFIHGQPDGPISFHYPGKDYLAEMLGDKKK